MEVRNYERGDKEKIVALWNICLAQEPITNELFKRKVLLKPNFDTKGCFVAEEERNLVGFILAIVRRIPNERSGLEMDRGWITVIFVHPDYKRKRVGSLLLKNAVDFLRLKKRKFVYVCGLSGSSPNFFWPGIDVERYAGAIEFFKKQHFIIDHYAYGMEKLLDNFEIPSEIKQIEEKMKKGGIIVQLLEKKYEKALLYFLMTHFPGDWHRHTKGALESGIDLGHFIIAVKDSKVIGYCYHEDEHFGPFGVAESFRRTGLGTTILFKAIERIRTKGGKRVFFKWADEGPASSFYSRHGFKITRKYAIMRRRIEGDFVV